MVQLYLFISKRRERAPPPVHSRPRLPRPPSSLPMLSGVCLFSLHNNRLLPNSQAKTDNRSTIQAWNSPSSKINVWTQTAAQYSSANSGKRG